MRGRLLVLAALAACSSEGLHLDVAEGDADGGQLVRIVGAGLMEHGPAVVYFGVRAAKAVVLEDDRHIAVKTPAAEAFGVVDVRVEFADGTAEVLPAAYTYVQIGGKPLRPSMFQPGDTPIPEAR